VSETSKLLLGIGNFLILINAKIFLKILVFFVINYELFSKSTLAR